MAEVSYDNLFGVDRLVTAEGTTTQASIDLSGSTDGNNMMIFYFAVGAGLSTDSGSDGFTFFEGSSGSGIYMGAFYKTLDGTEGTTTFSATSTTSWALFAYETYGLVDVPVNSDMSYISTSADEFDLYLSTGPHYNQRWGGVYFSAFGGRGDATYNNVTFTGAATRGSPARIQSDVDEPDNQLDTNNGDGGIVCVVNKKSVFGEYSTYDDTVTIQNTTNWVDDLDSTQNTLTPTGFPSGNRRGFVCLWRAKAPADLANVRITNRTGTTASIKFATDIGAGSKYAWVAEEGNDPPSVTTLKNWGITPPDYVVLDYNATLVETAGTQQIKATGLTPGKTYDVYLLHTAFGHDTAIQSGIFATFGRLAEGGTQALTISTNQATVDFNTTVQIYSVVPDKFDNGDTGIVATVLHATDLTTARVWVGRTEQTITGRTADTLTFTCVEGTEPGGLTSLTVTDYLPGGQDTTP